MRFARGRVCALAALLAAASGCQAPHPDVPGAAAAALGIDNAIVFRRAPEPLDAPALPPGTLTSGDALRLALRHDPRIQAALARVRMAEADAHQARLLPNPILSLDLRTAAGGANTVFEATFTGDLIALLQKPGQAGAADRRLRAAAADALTVVLDTASEVQEAYASAQAADAQIENAQRRDAILRQLRDISQKRVDAGEGVRLDVLTIDAQALQSALDLADLQLVRTTQRLTLARLIGQSMGDIQWPLEPGSAGPGETIAPERVWIEAALAHRPEIQSRVWEVRALGYDKAVAALAPFVGGEVGSHAEKDPEWRVGPMLTTPVPIFDFGQAVREKISAQQIAALQDLQQQQLAAIGEVRLAYATYVIARDALAAAGEKLVPVNQQQMDQARLSYQGGETDIATLLLAETNLDLALSRQIEQHLRMTVARSRLQRAAGGAAIAAQLLVPTSQPASTQPATQPQSLPGPSAGPSR